MGLTIHYKGALKEVALIEPLTAEVADIAAVMNWSFYQIAHPSFEGIMLIPEGCEPLQLTFDAEGGLVSGIALMHGIEPGEFVFTKTQYAGVEVHMALIRLLRYLTERYFGHFELVDEGGFWEGEDEEKLRRQFGRNEEAMNLVEGRIAAGDGAEGGGDVCDKVEGLVQRLEGLLRARRA